MDFSTINIIISSIVGLISGGIASIIAPWVVWAVGKKKLKAERRSSLITEWRNMVAKEDFDRSDLINNPSYSALRLLLTENIRNKIESSHDPHITIYCDGPPFLNDIQEMLMDEISRIENSWGLI